MSKQISINKFKDVFPNVIKYKLTFLRLSRDGKIRLTVFNDKTLYKAMDKMFELYDITPANSFSIYYALCVFMAEKLKAAPNWSKTSEYYNFDNSKDVTLAGESFDHKQIAGYLKEFRAMNIKVGIQPKQNYNKKTYNNNSSKTKGPSFNMSIVYFKYGQWFKYPDVKWSSDARPSLPVSSSQAKWLIDNGINPKDVLRKALNDNILAEEQVNIFHLYESPMMKEFLKEQSGERPRTNPVPLVTKIRLADDDPRQYDLNQIEELKGAIAIGKVSKTGLRFLRDTYIIHKPELIPIIDEHINS